MSRQEAGVHIIEGTESHARKCGHDCKQRVPVRSCHQGRWHDPDCTAGRAFCLQLWEDFTRARCEAPPFQGCCNDSETTARAQ